MTGAKVKVNARVNKQVHSEVAIVVRELEKAEEQERSVKVRLSWDEQGCF